MAFPNFLPERAARKCMRQQVKLFTFKDQCHLCGIPTARYIPQICIGCGKFEYCSTQCLEEDMSDHVKYCKLNYPKIKPVTRGYWHPLVSRFNARNAPRTPTPPQDDPEDKPRTLKSVQFIFIRSVASYPPRFERSATGRPLPSSLHWVPLPRLIPSQEPEPEDPFKPKSYLI